MKNTLIKITAATGIGAGGAGSVISYQQYEESKERQLIVTEIPGLSSVSAIKDFKGEAAKVGTVTAEFESKEFRGYYVTGSRRAIKKANLSPRIIVEEIKTYSIPKPPSVKSGNFCSGPEPTPVPMPPPQPGDKQVIDWGVARVGSPAVLPIIDGSEVTVCVLDTGIDQDHPDLGFTKFKNFTSSNERDIEDRQGHGTHTAGTVAALNNHYGVMGASQANLIIGKVLDDSGSGYNSWIASGIKWCADQGAEIISMSLGGPQPSSIIQSAIEYAISRGSHIYAAAGNESSSSVGFPAGYNYPGALFSVSATNQDDRLAYFSNYGKVEMTCPGVQILSTVPGGYDRYSGTSMATPICAGVAALYRAQDAEIIYEDFGNAQYYGKGMPKAEGVLQ